MSIQVFRLSNCVGDEVAILDWGARLCSWSTRLGSGKRNIVLGYQDILKYQQDPYYLGAVVGPYANRIGHGKLKIASRTYQLEQNEGNHHLHGGVSGLHHVRWQYCHSTRSQLSLRYLQQDGVGGYPGPVNYKLEFELEDCSRLWVRMQAEVGQISLVGPTFHPYFNLAADTISINDHYLQLDAEHFAVVDDAGIPTGELRNVKDSQFDFRCARVLADTAVDHNFVVGGSLKQSAASLISPDQHLKLAISADYPGLQLYTGDYLSTPFTPRQGLCLEPQFFPDSPNQIGFPFHFSQPDKPFEATLCYQLDK
ncbi:aldose epimerase family protein [Bowmanella yangjiangensis]|uniref:Galactose mutarotase n=1 Tax=Bowmanella yangjiangensis TaxID=2811230 RepID=A0ABS3CNG2_9ALTE|nr:aldose epimerase family protein [Bowmanella yangjiangensis]MBN7818597.1 galactose mutarotase [Bowmanella yangjiangensis]